MDLISSPDYKRYLKSVIEANRSTRGYQTQVSAAAGCSRSFLSQVLSTDIELTRDHAAGLAQFWHLSEVQTEYWLTLVDLARAKVPTLHSHLKRKLERMRLDAANLSSHVAKERIEGFEAEAVYYSSWLVSAVYMLLLNPKFHSSKAMADRLGAENGAIDRAVEQLIAIGLVERTKAGLRATKKDLNVSDSSPLSAINHTNWRMRAISSIQNRHPDALHYSSVFTVSRADADELQKNLRELILKSRKVILASASEELFCFNMDFFEL